MDSSKKIGKNIQSVQRAIDIIECFSTSEPALSLGEISDRLNLNKATVHGILNTLHNNDYICQNARGQYLLGRAIFSKAALASSSTTSRLLDCVSEALQTVCNQFGATGFVLTTENNRLQRAYTTTPTNYAFVLQPSAQIGPLYAMASGKLMLAYADASFIADYLAKTELVSLTKSTLPSIEAIERELSKIRKNEYSFEQDELAEGVSSIALPIVDHRGNIRATISLTGMSPIVLHKKQEMLLALKQICKLVNDANLFP